MFHKWTVLEDITVCAYAIAREDDPKTIKRLSAIMGIGEGRIAYRMSNFRKLAQGTNPDWHYSRQERRVFDWVSGNRALKLKTLL